MNYSKVISVYSVPRSRNRSKKISSCSTLNRTPLLFPSKVDIFKIHKVSLLKEIMRLLMHSCM